MDRPIVVADRIATASAVVALESSVLAQGLPAPANLESAEAQSTAVGKAGGEPAVVGVVAGRIVVGADPEQVRALASGKVRWKVTVRDLPYVVARGLDGATTVSATAFAAEAVGIEVMSTGGIGGIHFGGPDVSADLPQLARSHLTVVCSGPKHVADTAATLEWLETHGVLVVGFRTDRLPGFLAPGRLPLEHVVDDVGQVVDLIRVRRSLGSHGAMVLARRAPRSSWTGCTGGPAGGAWPPTSPCWRPTPAWPARSPPPSPRVVDRPDGRRAAQVRRPRAGQPLATTTTPSTTRAPPSTSRLVSCLGAGAAATGRPGRSSGITIQAIT
jgi:pseudouridine-5'-phosphate glycosidase